MTQHVTRRQFLVRSAELIAGAAAASAALADHAVVLALSEVRDEALVDEGEGFRRGTVTGVAVSAGVGELAVQATGGVGVFTSAVLQSMAPFTHVGLHWSGTVPPKASLSFELRTSRDGLVWSPWNAVPVSRGPHQTPVGDYFGSLIYAGDARFVQYRATLRAAGGASPRLRRVTATLIDSPVGVAKVVAAQQVQVTDEFGRTLVVTPREGWGATESYRFDRKGKELWPESFVSGTKLIVHHTATRNDCATADEAAAEVRAIYKYHAVTQRWFDIGYTALVDRFGTIYEGRHGRGENAGREYLSAGVVAGHDTSHNYGSVGVALLGDATKADWPMTSPSGPMWDALVRVGVFEAGRHSLRPKAADGSAAVSDFLRSDDTWSNAMRNVSGHRETNATACPGDRVMAMLDDLRSAIHAELTRVASAAVTVNGAGSRDLTLTSGLQLGFSWTVELPPGWAVAGYQTCFEGWYKPATSYDITYLEGYTASAWPNQPRSAWVDRGPDATSASFAVSRAGHYTLHVRATLQDGTGNRVTAPYASSYTYLVKSPTTGGKR